MASLYLAAITAAIDDSDRIQLFPYGEFRATDGRPDDVKHWIIADDNGKDICDLANRCDNRLVIDYEHQTLHTKKNGKPAPAAGWMDYFYLTPKGVFAEVEWTEKAKKMIKAGEYKYISPVFIYDGDGYIRKIYHAALTNNPALDGMDAAIAACLAAPELLIEEKKMTLLEQLKRLFKLPNGDEKAVQAAVSTLLEQSESADISVADVYKKLATATALADKNAGCEPDPAHYVPIAVVSDLQQQLAALKHTINTDKAEQLVEAALIEGKLLPAQKQWGIALATQDVDAFNDYVATVEPLVALTARQTQAQKFTQGRDNSSLLPEQVAVCQALGMTQATFKAALQED